MEEGDEAVVNQPIAVFSETADEPIDDFKVAEMKVEEAAALQNPQIESVEEKTSQDSVLRSMYGSFAEAGAGEGVPDARRSETEEEMTRSPRRPERRSSMPSCRHAVVETDV